MEIFQGHAQVSSVSLCGSFPPEEVASLYSPCKVFASALGNAISYVLCWKGMMVQKQMLEVVEVSHPNDLAFHLLMGINPPLISQTIRMFLVQLWDGSLLNYSCSIFELQHVHRHGDWVKIFAGSERGTFGCILNHAGENLTLTVSQHGEVIKVEVDPILVHSHMPDHTISEVTQIVQVAPSTLWVEPLAHCKLLKKGHLNNMKPTGSGELLCEDNTICLGDLFTGPSSICKDFMLDDHISLCMKISNWIPLLIHRGCEVWVITGNKKGCQAYLVLLACQSSIISMLGYPDFQVNNIDVVTSMGYLLTRDKLDDAHLKALIALQCKSEQSESDKTNNPWTISPLDLTPVAHFDPSIMP
ncbi:hypothetical protein V8B97DRAFT_2021531 [Scleroderma yunnanense]